MAAGANWTWEETLRAFALYFLIPTSRHHQKDKAVIALASSIGRSPSSIALKLGNIKAWDPMRKGTGLQHGSKLDSKVWDTYLERGDSLLEEALGLLTNTPDILVGPYASLEYEANTTPEGRERTVITTARANQSYFRNALLENYNHRCCISGIGIDQLLVASHIKPWKASDPVTERLTPENGLLLDGLWDRAFDKGFVTIDQSLRIVVSPRVPKTEPENTLLWSYFGRRITVPGRFKPRRDFIEYHNDCVFLS